MVSSLLGAGKDAPVLEFSGTEIRRDAAGKLTTIPLADIERLQAGRQDASIAFLIVAILGMAVALGGWYSGPGNARAMVAIIGGTATAVGALAAYILPRPRQVLVAGPGGTIIHPYRAKEAQKALAFVEDVKAARDEMLARASGHEAMEANGTAATGGPDAAASDAVGDGPQ